MYNENGSDFVDPTLGYAPLEFRINATTQGNQLAPGRRGQRPQRRFDHRLGWPGSKGWRHDGHLRPERRSTSRPDEAELEHEHGNVPEGHDQSGKRNGRRWSVGHLHRCGRWLARASRAVASEHRWHRLHQHRRGDLDNVHRDGATAAQSDELYRAVFANQAGSATTAAAALVVQSPPTITTEPENQTINAASPVTFAAAATGLPTPSVQWQISTDGTNWSNVSGATSPNYTFTVGMAQTGNEYRAVFTTPPVPATTLAATLTVNPVPVIATNPASQTARSVRR